MEGFGRNSFTPGQRPQRQAGYLLYLRYFLFYLDKKAPVHLDFRFKFLFTVRSAVKFKSMSASKIFHVLKGLHSFFNVNQ